METTGKDVKETGSQVTHKVTEKSVFYHSHPETKQSFHLLRKPLMVIAVLPGWEIELLAHFILLIRDGIMGKAIGGGTTNLEMMWPGSMPPVSSGSPWAGAMGLDLM